MIDESEEPINWQDIDESRDAFEAHWKPASWEKNRRFVLVRQFVTEQRKGPLQYDLFEPRSYKFDCKAVITNRKDLINNVVLCHEGLGSQDGIIAELKSESALAYVPTGTWLGNRAFMRAVLIAHNVTRELPVWPASNRCVAATMQNGLRCGYLHASIRFAAELCNERVD
jgi:hypothetical protein